MRHLRLVPTLTPAPASTPETDRYAGFPVGVRAALEEAEQLHLQLVGIDPPTAVPHHTVDGDLAGLEDVVLPELSPDLQVMFGQMDLLLDGMDEQRRLRALDTLYFDAENRPRARSEILRAL